MTIDSNTLDRRTALGLFLATAIIPGVTNAATKKTTGLSPLLKPWSGPYGGVPPFDKVRVKDFLGAYTQAIAMQKADIKAITSLKKAPNFDNTILGLERAGKPLSRLNTVYFIWDSNLNTPELQKISEKILPKLSALSDEITQNKALFARVESVYNQRATLGLNAEQDRLLWLTYIGFVRSGAKLSPESKKRVAAINQELSLVYNQFSNNQLHDEGQFTFLTKDEMKGIPAAFAESLALVAKEQKKEGQFALMTTRSSMEPFLTLGEHRGAREKIWRAYIMRGDNPGANDNKPLISKILKLRFERAQLLGYATHAHWRLEDSMAKTPDNAMKLMQSVWPAAVGRVREEVADMQAIADKEGAGLKIEPWDYRFYAEKVRKAKYDLDDGELKPYLQLEKLREGMFWVANKMYGFSFEQIQGVPVFHPDVRTFKVMRGGKDIGLWYFDPYARTGKQSGAWMNAYREQSRMDAKEVITLVSNNSNFIKTSANEPVLISWDDAETMFHEFGHALHGLSSNVTYTSLSGTNVSRDFVEFPSQLNEHWLSLPEVLAKFAVHYKTGESMPLALQQKVINSAKFNQGFKTVEYLSSALIDMKLHLAGGVDIDADRFEKEELSKLGMPHEIVMRHRTPQFGHVFSGDGYSAGYYSYLWSDSLVADVHEAFVSEGGPFKGEVSKRYYDTILSVGNTLDQAQAFRNFRGRDVDPQALMRDRGFV